MRSRSVFRALLLLCLNATLLTGCGGDESPTPEPVVGSDISDAAAGDGDSSTGSDDATDVRIDEQVSDGGGDSDGTVSTDGTDTSDTTDLPDLGNAPVEVGPSGGVVHSADGVLTLTFPAGALSESETITITPIGVGTLAPPMGLTLHSSAYDLGPDGLEFDVPIGVTMEIDSDELPEHEDPGIRFHQFLLHGSATILDIVSDTETVYWSDDEVTVSGEIGHFSVITAANSPAYSQLAVPDPAGDQHQIFNYIHYAGVRRESAAGNAFRVLEQTARRGEGLELLLEPGAYPPGYLGTFYGSLWEKGIFDPGAAYIYVGELRTWISDKTKCTSTGRVTDTDMDTTIGIYTLGGPFTSLVETKSRLIYNIPVRCNYNPDYAGYYVGRTFNVLSRYLEVDSTEPTIGPPPEVDPDEQSTAVFGST
ncbi:MAG: hypothetical protein KC561_11615, partial [Myxococcales bacterium]|nr:hypothetical protein [Myxococcales bacterium]